MGRFCHLVCALCTVVGFPRCTAVEDRQQSPLKELASLLFAASPSLAPGLRPRPTIAVRPTHVAFPLKEQRGAQMAKMLVPEEKQSKAPRYLLDIFGWRKNPRLYRKLESMTSGKEATYRFWKKSLKRIVPWAFLTATMPYRGLELGPVLKFDLVGPLKTSELLVKAFFSLRAAVPILKLVPVPSASTMVRVLLIARFLLVSRFFYWVGSTFSSFLCEESLKLTASRLNTTQPGGVIVVDRVGKVRTLKALTNVLAGKSDREALLWSLRNYSIPEAYLGFVYKEVFQRFLSTGINKSATLEVSLLIRLQHALMLPDASVGNMIYQFTEDYKDVIRQYLDSDFTVYDKEYPGWKKQYFKFFYLAEAVMSQFSPEEYRYHQHRIQKKLKVPPETWTDDIDNLNMPIYEQSFRSSVYDGDDGEPTTSEELVQLRKLLAISAPRAEQFVTDLFKASVAAKLNVSNEQFTDADKEEFEKIRTVGNVSAETYSQIFGELVYPLYRPIVQQVWAENEVLGETASDMLMSRQQGLIIPDTIARSIEYEEMRPGLQEEAIELVERIGGVRAAKLKVIVTPFLDKWDNSAKFMLGSRRSSDEKEFAKNVNLTADATPLQTTYDRLLLESWMGDQHTDSLLASYRRLWTVFQLDESGANEIASKIIGVAAKQLVKKTVISDPQKTKLNEFRNALGLPKDAIKNVSIGSYFDALALVGGKEDMNDQDFANLATIRDALGLEFNDVSELHVDVLGQKYIDAVSKDDTDFDFLDKLQVRFGFSDESASTLYKAARENQLLALLDDLFWRSGKKKEGQDLFDLDYTAAQVKEEIPEYGMVTPEVTQILEFVDRNDLIQNGKLVVENFDPPGGTLEAYTEYLAETLPEIDFDDVERVNKVQDDLRQLVAVLQPFEDYKKDNRFINTTSGEGAQKLLAEKRGNMTKEEEEKDLAGAKNEKILAELVFRILMDYFPDIATDKDLTPKQEAFVKKISNFIGLDEAKPLRLFDEARVLSMATKLEWTSEVFQEEVRELVDMSTDLDIGLADRVSSKGKERFTVLTIKELIEEDELTPGDFSVLEPVRDAFGFSEERMIELILQTTKAQENNAIDAWGSYLQREYEECAKSLDTLAKFLVIATPFGGLKFTERHQWTSRDVERMMNIYRTTNIGEVSPEDREERAEALEVYLNAEPEESAQDDAVQGAGDKDSPLHGLIDRALEVEENRALEVKLDEKAMKILEDGVTFHKLARAVEEFLYIDKLVDEPKASPFREIADRALEMEENPVLAGEPDEKA